MNLSDCKFSEKDIQELQDHRDRQKDAELRQRFSAIISAAVSPDGIENGIKRTARIFGKHPETVKNRLIRYRTGGAEKPDSFSCKPEKSYPDMSETDQAVIYVTFGNPSDVGEVRDYIEQKSGISYCAEAVGKILIKHGPEFIRPKTVPGNTPPQKNRNSPLNNTVK